MARVSTRIRRRLTHLQRRRQRQKNVRTYAQMSSRYRFDASLRIAGVGVHHDEIFSRTGIASTRSHRKGEPRGRNAALGCWTEDLWCLESPLGEQATIDQHLEWLQSRVAPHKAYFIELRARAEWADLCLGCLSESPYPFLSASPGALALMKDLDLGLSFNFTCV
ncbi:MAG TPA: DUF4279 domain-containing protein [Variovorax sp.]